MSTPKKHVHHWLTPQQQLLLRTILLREPKETLLTWQAWISQVDIDTLDSESLRLLPQLYRCLSRYNVEHPVMPRMKGMYRYIWTKNQQYIYQLAPLLEALHDVGSKTLLVNDSAMAVGYYKDSGVRRMDRLDVCVPESQVSEAIKVFETCGWFSDKPLPEKDFDNYFSKNTSHEFKNKAGLTCILHWQLFPTFLHTDTEDRFWEDAVSCSVQGVPTFMLNPSDQLLHLCVYGVALRRISPIQWITGAMTVLNAAQAEIDWQLLISLTESLHVVLSLQMALTYLHDVLDAPVPLGVLQRLEDLPVSSYEHEFMTGFTQLSLIDAVRYHWTIHKNLNSSVNVIRRLLRLPNYFRQYWGLQSVWHMPGYIVTKAFQTIWRGGLI